MSYKCFSEVYEGSMYNICYSVDSIGPHPLLQTYSAFSYCCTEMVFFLSFPDVVGHKK
jgi:hypothetical protein